MFVVEKEGGGVELMSPSRTKTRSTRGGREQRAEGERGAKGRKELEGETRELVHWRLKQSVE